MRVLRCFMLLATLALVGAFRPLAAAEPQLHPSWLVADAAAHRVQIDLVSGWNGANDSLNFNGYAKGGMTVVVPLGWTVELAFKNADTRMAHSAVVTKAFAEADMPNVAGSTAAALPRAYTKNPTGGVFAPEGDTIHFVAKTAGEYAFFCGAPGHGRRGMWTRFTVDAAATAPYVTLAPGAAAGRP